MLAWYEPRTFTTNERVTQETSCPAGANSSSTKYPAIVSFNGRTDCFCSSTSCYFEGAGVLTTTTATGVLGSARILVRNINVTIPGEQRAGLSHLFAQSDIHGACMIAAVDGRGSRSLQETAHGMRGVAPDECACA